MKESFKMKYRNTISLVVATLIALMVVAGTYKSWCDKNINLSFNSTNAAEITYKLFYTTKATDNFNSKQVVSVPVQEGKHNVKMIIKAPSVSKIRLNIGSYPGTVNISKLKLNGHASVDLSDFSSHEYINIDEEEILPDGSITITSEQDNPYISIKSVFNMHRGYDIDYLKAVLLFGSVFVVFYTLLMLALYEKKKKKKDLTDYY